MGIRYLGLLLTMRTHRRQRLSKARGSVDVLVAKLYHNALALRGRIESFPLRKDLATIQGNEVCP